MIRPGKSDVDPADCDRVASSHRFEVEGSLEFVFTADLQHVIDCCLGSEDRNPLSWVRPVANRVIGGDQIEPVIGMFMRDHDRAHEIDLEWQCDESSRPGVAPDPGFALRDQIARGGAATGGIGARGTDDIQLHGANRSISQRSLSSR